jgi:hypothetical protein
MEWRLARWCLIGALGCGIAGPAAAKPLSPEVAARASELRKEAHALYKKIDPTAIERLRSAWELSRDVVDLCNLGKYQFDLGQERKGAGTLSRCLSMLPPPEVDKELAAIRRAVERYLKMADAMLGTLTIEGNVPGAEVLIDGEPAGKLPLEGPVFVDPGWRNVEVRAPGFNSDSQRVEAREGKPVNVKMQLARLKPEGGPRAELVEPPSSAAEQGPAEAEPSRALLKTGVVLSGIGAVAGIGGFVAAGVLNGDADALYGQALRDSRLDKPCTRPVYQYQSLCDEVVSKGRTAKAFTAVGVGGVVVAAGGVVLILYDLLDHGSPKKKRKTSTSAAVVGIPGGGGLWVQGRF